jgi:hypothetical protein
MENLYLQLKSTLEEQNQTSDTFFNSNPYPKQKKPPSAKFILSEIERLGTG